MSGRDRHRTVISHVAPGPIPDVATLFGKLPLIVQYVLFCRSIYADISIGFRLIGFCRRVSAGRESFADAPLADSETGSPDSAEWDGSLLCPVFAFWEKHRGAAYSILGSCRSKEFIHLLDQNVRERNDFSLHINSSNCLEKPTIIRFGYHGATSPSDLVALHGHPNTCPPIPTPRPIPEFALRIRVFF